MDSVAHAVVSGTYFLTLLNILSRTSTRQGRTRFASQDLRMLGEGLVAYATSDDASSNAGEM